MARRINQIVIHCSATKPSWTGGASEIRSWHVDDRGWNDIGYHYVIERDGRIQEGRKESTIGAHVYGHNRHSLGICLVGGVSEETGAAESNYTRAQWGALEALISELKWRHKKAEVLGHRDFPGVKKECPSFNVRAWDGVTPEKV